MYRYYILSCEDDEIYKEKGVVSGKTYAEALANVVSYYGDENICKICLEFITEAPLAVDTDIKGCDCII